MLFRSGASFHSAFREIIDSPPEGYKFVRTTQNTTRVYSDESDAKRLLGRTPSALRPYAYNFAFWLANRTGVPAMREVPSNVDLIFSAHSLLPTCMKPWVVSIEHVGDLCPLMYDFRHLPLYAHTVRRIISSPKCKAVLPWTHAGARSVFRALGAGVYRERVKPIHLATKAKPLVQRSNEGECRILFVNTSNFVPTQIESPAAIAEQTNYFYTKGGGDLLGAFAVLAKKYDHLTLILRSYVPQEEIENHAALIERGRILVFRDVLPAERLRELFASSDIFAYPANLTPAMAIIEAMSYGLPVVTTNYWANTEMVEDERTGLIIEKRKDVNNVAAYEIPNIADETGAFQAVLRRSDPRFVGDLATALARLVEDSSLRRRLGMNGWKETQDGEFSIAKRNKRLRSVFDEALA